VEHKDTTIHYRISTYDPVTDTIVHGESIWLQYPGKQKNWVAFEDVSDHDKPQLLFIQQINPLHIVKVSDVNTATKTARVSSVVQDKYAVNLQWNGTEYGESIRGGTPAIMVDGVRLSFFHTCLRSPLAEKILTYYMGAITFCPSFPYQIHSISKVPITHPSLYSGKWTHSRLDYVAYPDGIILDADGKHVWVSVGHQDRDSYILKMDVAKLYSSMRIISDCAHHNS
jgi:hypothetical protein